jgi:hypothetical protein
MKFYYLPSMTSMMSLFQILIMDHGNPTDFHVDVSKIQSTDTNDQQAELQQLGIRAFNQQDFEEGKCHIIIEYLISQIFSQCDSKSCLIISLGVAAQVDEALRRKEEARAFKLLQQELNTIVADLR